MEIIIHDTEESERVFLSTENCDNSNFVSLSIETDGDDFKSEYIGDFCIDDLHAATTALIELRTQSLKRDKLY